MAGPWSPFSLCLLERISLSACLYLCLSLSYSLSRNALAVKTKSQYISWILMLLNVGRAWRYSSHQYTTRPDPLSLYCLLKSDSGYIDYVITNSTDVKLWWFIWLVCRRWEVSCAEETTSLNTFDLSMQASSARNTSLVLVNLSQMRRLLNTKSLISFPSLVHLSFTISFSSWLPRILSLAMELFLQQKEKWFLHISSVIWLSLESFKQNCKWATLMEAKHVAKIVFI